MLQIPAKRKNEKYDLALFKEGNKILTLFKNNSLVYVNTESIEETQKNKDHFQMLLLNAIYLEITIKGGSSYMYIQGNLCSAVLLGWKNTTRGSRASVI